MTAGGKWLLIPVEVQVRELLSRLLVAVIAAERGYRVLIGHDRVIRRLAPHLPKGILLDKGLGMTGDRKVARYHRLGYRIACIDEEMTGIYPNPEYFLRTRLSADTLSKADRWFAISDKARDLAVAEYPDFADRFVTTGLPRTDIWQPRFHGLYAAERDAIRARHGRFILFCSNFGQIVHARRGAFVDKQLARHNKGYGKADEYNARIEQQLAANLEAFIAMLPKLRSWFPGHRLVVRPHPVESREFWQQALAGIEGAQVDGEGIATPMILSADALVHHGCMTGLEAEIMGVPQVMYAPHPDDHHDTELMAAIAPVVRTEAALRKALAAMLKTGRRKGPPPRAVEEWFAAQTGALASERIIAELDKLSSRGGDLPGYLRLLRFSPRQLWAEHGIRSAKAAAYARQKWQDTNLATMREYVSILCRAALLRHRLDVQEVFPQLFQVRFA
jgi:surface carbohydrate biosynthesis protein